MLRNQHQDEVLRYAFGKRLGTRRLVAARAARVACRYFLKAQLILVASKARLTFRACCLVRVEPTSSVLPLFHLCPSTKHFKVSRLDKLGKQWQKRVLRRLIDRNVMTCPSGIHMYDTRTTSTMLSLLAPTRTNCTSRLGLRTSTVSFGHQFALVIPLKGTRGLERCST